MKKVKSVFGKKKYFIYLLNNTSSMNEQKIFPIVLTCDDAYFKHASVVITSLMCNSKESYHYEIVILSEYISEENQALGQWQVAHKPNFSLRFVTLQNIENQGGGIFISTRI